MDGPGELLPVLGPVTMGDNHRGPRGQAGEDPHHQLHDEGGGASHGSQGVRAHELPHNDGVYRGVELLEESPRGDGEEKEKQLLPDDALGQVQIFLRMGHGKNSFQASSPKRRDQETPQTGTPRQTFYFVL